LKVDVHVHTRYSGHSILKVEDVARIAKKRCLDAVAITDHDAIKGALELSKVFPTIIAEEVSSDEGDVIGLFLREKVEKGPALEVMDKIRAQGALVMIPHPFDTMRKEALMKEELVSKGDIIEVFNSRVLRQEDNERARKFAVDKSLPMIVGSDAHTSVEIGRSFIEIDSVDDPRLFMRALENAKLHSRRSSVLVHGQTKVLKLWEAFR
jgi:predicted metal-dependent phosphoesterase TrpH